MATLQLITAPAIEPVTLAEQKLHSRVDITDDDTLISSCIVAARRWVENVTGQRLINQVWKMWLDSFPQYVDYTKISFSFLPSAVSYGQPTTIPLIMKNDRPDTIIIPLGPVVSVDEIAYVDKNASTTVWANTNYVVDSVSLPARIVRKSITNWPSPAAGLQEANAVSVKFTVGYGTATTQMPDDLKHAIKLVAGAFYENRESISEAALAEVPMAVNALIAPYRMYQGGGL